jgi:hypothetical protein
VSTPGQLVLGILWDVEGPMLSVTSQNSHKNAAHFKMKFYSQRLDRFLSVDTEAGTCVENLCRVAVT